MRTCLFYTGRDILPVQFYMDASEALMVLLCCASVWDIDGLFNNRLLQIEHQLVVSKGVVVLYA